MMHCICILFLNRLTQILKLSVFFLCLSQTLYWASIKESLPKWEQFLLGRAEVPIGFKKMKTAEQNISYQEEDSQK